MLRELSLEELKEIYDTLLVDDFPACEVKPFWAMLKMHEAKEYFAYGNFEDGKLVAYVLIVKPKEGKVALLDYFAVAKAKRGGGYGSKTLEELKGYFGDTLSGFLIESEHIKEAKDEQDREKRCRRIHFYEKNGLIRQNFVSRVYGTMYTILFLPIGKEEADAHLKVEEDLCLKEKSNLYLKNSLKEKSDLYLNKKQDLHLKEEYRKIYKVMIPASWNEENVQVWDA